MNSSARMDWAEAWASRARALVPGEPLARRTEASGFAAGTRIRTLRGEVAIEELRPDDAVVTASGASSPIRRILCRTATRRTSSRERMPLRIAAHAFGPGRPARALLVSPDLAVCVDCLGEVLIPIGALRNNATIARHEGHSLTYWQIELEGSDLIVAEALAVESESPCGIAGDTRASPADADRAGSCRPLHTEGPVADLVRAQLAKRSAAIGWTESTAFEVHLEVDGRRLEPTLLGSTARFVLPSGAGGAWLVSPTARPSDSAKTTDSRDLGLAVESFRIVDGFAAPDGIAMDDPRLCVGFHPIESGSRWTTGRALLPDALWAGRAGPFFLVVDFARAPLPRWRAPESDAASGVASQPAPGRLDPPRSPAVDQRLFYWCEDTLRVPYETGIQRVTRRLGRGLAALGVDVVPVGWDRDSRRMIVLEPDGGIADESVESLIRSAKARSWLLIPEVTQELSRSEIDPVRIGRAYGLPTAALLHDLIPLKQEQFYSDDFLAVFRPYSRMFFDADLVLTATNWVADDLRAYAQATGARIPRIVVAPFGGQFGERPRSWVRKPERAPEEPLRLLAVGTWEPRKNLPRLLRAVRAAEATCSTAIELASVGRRGVHPALDAEVEALRADMPRVTWQGSLSDAELVALYARSHASVYASYEEGFGLPVMESLWLATPCVSHDGSSLAEIAPGGGVLTVDMTDEDALARTLVALAQDHELLPRLSSELLARPLRDWNDYAEEVARALGLGM